MSTRNFDPSLLPLEDDQESTDALVGDRDQDLLLGRLLSRRMALADQIVDVNRELVKLAARGLVSGKEGDRLRNELASLQAKHDTVVADITEALKQIPDESGYTPNSEVDQGESHNAGLVRLRHPNRDFFVADLLDYALKDDGASMEAPIFTLSTRPDLSVWEWTSKDGNKRVKVTPSVLGRATQHDKDVLIYVVSHMAEALNRGREDTKNRVVRFTVYDFLVATNRGVGGDDYRRLQETFDRLSGTRIKTNIRTGGERITDNFGILDRVRVIEKSQDDERMIAVEITLSEWLYNAIQAFEVLTIHPDYFRLRKPLARRLYEIARKHCGHQAQWKISLGLLRDKAGSKSRLPEFRRMVKAVQSDGSMPGYRFSLGDDDMVTFYTTDSRHLTDTLTRRFKG